jgi:hypothetical protein
VLRPRKRGGLSLYAGRAARAAVGLLRLLRTEGGSVPSQRKALGSDLSKVSTMPPTETCG